MNTLDFLRYMERDLLAAKKCPNNEGPENCVKLKCPHLIGGECAEIRYLKEFLRTKSNVTRC
jgi:hypothetical protein